MLGPYQTHVEERAKENLRPFTSDAKPATGLVELLMTNSQMNIEIEACQ